MMMKWVETGREVVGVEALDEVFLVITEVTGKAWELSCRPFSVA